MEERFARVIYDSFGSKFFIKLSRAFSFCFDDADDSRKWSEFKENIDF
jgi:hypothetical protein